MTSPVRVEFFLGVASRYSYLASTQIDALQRDTGCEVEWRPLFSGDLVALRGVSPFRGDPVSGQYDWSYRRRDAEDWAAFYGVPYSEPPDHLIHDYTLLRRLAVAATAAARFGAAEPFTRRLLDAVFNDRPARFDDDLFVRFAAECGLDEDTYRARLDDEVTVRLLADTTREAHDRGAFGVPTFFVGERMFWGNDRLVLLQHHLTQHKA